MKFSTTLYAILLSAGTFAAQAAPVTLTTAAQDNSPKFIQQGGKMTGIGVDVLRALEKIDPELRFSGEQAFWPLKRIENGLLAEVASGPEHIDVFVGLSRTTEREKKFHFIPTMLYSVKNVVFVRAGDDAKVGSLEDIAKLPGENIVLANNGYAQATLARGVQGLKVDDGAKTNIDNFKKLIDGKARFFFVSQVAGQYEVKQQSLQKQVKAISIAGEESEQYVTYSAALPKATADKLEAAIKKLVASGEMTRILAKYK